MVGRELESKLRDYLGSKNRSGFGQMPLIGLATRIVLPLSKWRGQY